MRVDLFTPIHKGLRSLLFGTAMEAARIDFASDQEVDALSEIVERTLGFLHEHAHLEDAEVLPLLRHIDPALAANLYAGHLELEAAENELGRAMRSVAMAAAADRRPSGLELGRLLNVLTAKHLLHMAQEETLGNAVLRGTFGDPELHDVRRRMFARTSLERRKEWLAILAPMLDPTERALMAIREPVEVDSADREVVPSVT